MPVELHGLKGAPPKQRVWLACCLLAAAMVDCTDRAAVASGPTASCCCTSRPLSQPLISAPPTPMISYITATSKKVMPGMLRVLRPEIHAAGTGKSVWEIVSLLIQWFCHRSWEQAADSR